MPVASSSVALKVPTTAPTTSSVTAAVDKLIAVGAELVTAGVVGVSLLSLELEPPHAVKPIVAVITALARRDLRKFMLNPNIVCESFLFVIATILITNT